MDIMYIDRSARSYQSFPLHQHDFWEITINLSGRGVATIDQVEYPFQEGTIFCVAPGIAHKKISDEGFVDGSLMLREFVPFGAGGLFLFEDDTSGSMQYLFRLMFDVTMKDIPNSQAVIHALADVMYQMMVSWSLTGSRNQVVERFQKIILDNIANPDFDLGHALLQCGYSTSYFRKVFKRSMGQSPNSYLNQVRIEYASRQIQQYYGTRSLKEIALQSGFEDPYYFSRVFHQYTGHSPTEYGRKMGGSRLETVNWDGQDMSSLGIDGK